MPKRGSSFCRRCGMERDTAYKNRPLCRDCRSVLSPAEQALWRDTPPVQLKQKEVA